MRTFLITFIDGHTTEIFGNNYLDIINKCSTVFYSNKHGSIDNIGEL